MSAKKKRKWNGLWFEPTTEHITDHQAWTTYRRLTGFARKKLFGPHKIKKHVGRVPFAWEWYLP